MFDRKRYLDAWHEGITEPEILALIAECGGEAGAVEDSRFENASMVRLTRSVPIYHADGGSRSSPVDVAYISEIVA